MDATGKHEVGKTGISFARGLKRGRRESREELEVI
jgi:hypothetical protein